jgi:hypothetical protein
MTVTDGKRDAREELPIILLDADRREHDPHYNKKEQEHARGWPPRAALGISNLIKCHLFFFSFAERHANGSTKSPHE